MQIDPRPRQRRRRAGMTLVEIMIVVIIMALLAAAVGAAVIPRWIDAQNKEARIDAQTIRSAAEQYVLGHDGAACPSTQQLVDDRILSHQRRTTDPWNHEFQIACEGSEVLVVSAGRDGQMGTDDDIR